MGCRTAHLPRSCRGGHAGLRAGSGQLDPRNVRDTGDGPRLDGRRGRRGGRRRTRTRLPRRKLSGATSSSRPIYGYGFGKVASDFSTGYSYELSYLDLLLKAGLIGLLLYLSFPLRLVYDALRLRFGFRPLPETAGGAGTAGIVVGVIVGILLAGATNPYLFAAFGLVSILAMTAWLEPGGGPAGGSPEEPSRTSPPPL